MKYAIPHAQRDNAWQMPSAGGRPHLFVDGCGRLRMGRHGPLEMITWDIDPHNIWLENFVPTQIDLNGDQIAGEMVTSRSGSPAMAAQVWERSARQWRISNPDGVKHFRTWIG